MAQTDRSLERARWVARWMDRRFIDPILGLVLPGVGDLVGAAVSFYLVVVALQLRLPAVVIARMLLNIGLEALFGAIPVLGDLFDFTFRANVRNLELLEARYAARSASLRDWLEVGGAVLFVVAALAIPIWAVVRLAGWLVSAF